MKWVEKRGWTISLNAPFGNGKTTFLKMFEHFIKNEKKEDYEVLFINAWESDFSTEPVIAILAEFVNYLKQKDQNLTTKNIDLTKVIKVMGTLANQFMQSKTGLNFKEAIGDQELGHNLLKEFDQRKLAVKEVKNILSNYHNDTEKKLLIIVDELDRTKPDYAVDFLEDIKHFFDIENVAFLVAVNQTQMKATVKCLFGQDLDFEGYYRKFFKQEMDLPDPYIKAQNLIDNLINEISLENNIKPEDRKSIIKNSYLFCKMFQLTLREIQILIRNFEMILKNKSLIIEFKYVYAYSFFICLFLKRKNVFKSILKGDFNVDKFISFIRKNSSLKAFIENPKNEKYDKERYPLYIVTQFFSKKEPKSEFEKDKKTIEEIFGMTIMITFSSHDQMAVKICKKIDRFQPHFK